GYEQPRPAVERPQQGALGLAPAGQPWARGLEAIGPYPGRAAGEEPVRPEFRQDARPHDPRLDPERAGSQSDPGPQAGIPHRLLKTRATQSEVGPTVVRFNIESSLARGPGGVCAPRGLELLSGVSRTRSGNWPTSAARGASGPTSPMNLAARHRPGYRSDCCPVESHRNPGWARRSGDPRRRDPGGSLGFLPIS